MKNKYYTPTIEEFHVGFEIEVNVEGEWIKIPYMNNYLQGTGKPNILDIHNDLENGRIRVKYLDREDIESLGWESLSGGWYNLVNVSGELGYYCYVRLRIWDKNSFIEAYRYDPNTSSNENEKERLFSGWIKNKSELRKIMKMMHIL